MRGSDQLNDRLSAFKPGEHFRPADREPIQENGSPTVPDTQPQNLRARSRSAPNGEVAVLGHNYGECLRGLSPDLPISSRTQIEVMNVISLMSPLLQPLSEDRRQLLIDEEPHSAARTGWFTWAEA